MLGSAYAAYSFRGDANTSLGFKCIVYAKAGAAGISLFQGRQLDNSLVFDVDYGWTRLFWRQRRHRHKQSYISPARKHNRNVRKYRQLCLTGGGGGGCSIAWDGVSCSSDIRLKEMSFQRIQQYGCIL